MNGEDCRMKEAQHWRIEDFIQFFELWILLLKMDNLILISSVILYAAKQVESSDDIRSEGQVQHFSTQFTSGSHEKIENEATEENYQPIFHQITTSEKLPRVIQMRNQAELQLEEFNCLKRVTEARSTQKKSERSNALVETVNEICIKGTKEQSMEIARVTFGIERGIFSDLVDDIVKDFSNCCFKMLQGSCRKRLCF